MKTPQPGMPYGHQTNIYLAAARYEDPYYCAQCHCCYYTTTILLAQEETLSRTLVEGEVLLPQMPCPSSLFLDFPSKSCSFYFLVCVFLIARSRFKTIGSDDFWWNWMSNNGYWWVLMGSDGFWWILMESDMFWCPCSFFLDFPSKSCSFLVVHFWLQGFDEKMNNSKVRWMVDLKQLGSSLMSSDDIGWVLMGTDEF